MGLLEGGVWASSASLLPRQTELDAQSEISGGGGEAVVCQQRCVGLSVVIKAHREQAGESIVCHEAQLECRVAAAGVAADGGYVAADVRLASVAQVQTQVEVVVGATPAAYRCCGGRLRLVAVASALDLTHIACAEELEVVDAIAQP